MNILALNDSNNVMICCKALSGVFPFKLSSTSAAFGEYAVFVAPFSH
jgi:hypothetical protein